MKMIEMFDLDDDLPKLRAEIERLRIALQQVVALDGFHDLMDAKSIAHRALTSSGET